MSNLCPAGRPKRARSSPAGRRTHGDGEGDTDGEAGGEETCGYHSDGDRGGWLGGDQPAPPKLWLPTFVSEFLEGYRGRTLDQARLQLQLLNLFSFVNSMPIISLLVLFAGETRQAFVLPPVEPRDAMSLLELQLICAALSRWRAPSSSHRQHLSPAWRWRGPLVGGDSVLLLQELQNKLLCSSGRAWLSSWPVGHRREPGIEEGRLCIVVQ